MTDPTYQPEEPLEEREPLLCRECSAPIPDGMGWLVQEPGAPLGLICSRCEGAERKRRTRHSACSCGHVKALHKAYGPLEPPEACRGALGTCSCNAFDEEDR